jgi:hypothetical protein
MLALLWHGCCYYLRPLTRINILDIISVVIMKDYIMLTISIWLITISFIFSFNAVPF